MTSYEETLDYLFSRLPMFTRIGSAAYKKDLTNIKALCKALGNPHKAFKSIHIAGTNGKGSTSHMLASVLQEAGYKTGLHTSPHLLDFRERSRVNGKMISKKEVIEFVEQHKALIEEIEPSFFEISVAIAFNHFAKESVDIAVIETGLGGRLDSTNIITPILSIITNISFDHMNMLGDTVTAIATEKAGIIKADVPVIIGQAGDEEAEVFHQKASHIRSLMKWSEKTWTAERISETPESATYSAKRMGKVKFENLQLDLPGTYQQYNLATVLTAIDQLINIGYDITEDHILAGLSKVKANTGLRGRWEKLSESPLTFCDVGHNEAGIREVLKMFKPYESMPLHFVLGMVNDKDHDKVLSMLPKNATYYYCKPNIPRGQDAETLRAEGIAHGLHGAVYDSVAAACEAAKRQAIESKGWVYIGGSTFVVAEALGAEN